MTESKFRLEGYQKRYLRGLANPLEPVVMIGRRGITESLVQKVDASLESHELIKIRFQEFKEEKKRMSEEIAEKTSSVVVGIVGHVAMLYRGHPDPEKRKIDLPQRE